MPLTSISLSESAAAFSGAGARPTLALVSATGGGTPSSLSIGSALTCSAAYPLTEADIESSMIVNQVAATALPNGGASPADLLSDLSDSGNAGDGGSDGSLMENHTTKSPLPGPYLLVNSLKAVKTASTAGFSSPVRAGDTLAYTITVTNNGTQTISGLSLADTLTSAENPRTITGPAFVSATSGSSAASLPAGGTATFSASYVLTQADIEACPMQNTVTASGADPRGGAASDVCDDGDNADGNTSDDPTVTPLPKSPHLILSKSTGGAANVGAGQVIIYTYTVTNSGNQTVSNITIADTHNGHGPLPIPAGELLLTDNAPLGDSTDVASNDSTWSILSPGDVIRFTGTCTVTQPDIDYLQ